MRKATEEQLLQALEKEGPTLNRKERRLIKYSREQIKTLMAQPKHAGISAREGVAADNRSGGGIGISNNM